MLSFDLLLRIVSLQTELLSLEGSEILLPTVIGSLQAWLGPVGYAL